MYSIHPWNQAVVKDEKMISIQIYPDKIFFPF